jgi:hypothetical protein
MDGGGIPEAAPKALGRQAIAICAACPRFQKETGFSRIKCGFSAMINSLISYQLNSVFRIPAGPKRHTKRSTWA